MYFCITGELDRANWEVERKSMNEELQCQKNLLYERESYIKEGMSIEKRGSKEIAGLTIFNNCPHRQVVPFHVWVSINF